ncbi:MAG: hypothetical protein KAY24_18710 [Candidatus Eisenbacteria sp.]|nr:hypothetical protein [Candidatus Eisenbacteria bacterium]
MHRFGLWSWQDIHFSVDGSLRNTVRRLVREAEAGATQRELQERLRIRVYNTLLDLLRKGEIDRDRLARVYVYLHTDRRVRASQFERRQEILTSIAESREAEASDEVVIQVLLTLIRYPGLEPGEVVRRLRGHSPPVTMQQAEAVFTRYELGEKGDPRRTEVLPTQRRAGGLVCPGDSAGNRDDRTRDSTERSRPSSFRKEHTMALLRKVFVWGGGGGEKPQNGSCHNSYSVRRLCLLQRAVPGV